MADGIGRQKWWAAGALAAIGVVIGIDGTVLSLALPTLALDLGASTAQLQWFVDSYLLVLAAAMLPAGLLGDRFGRKRMLSAALALFGLGSVACAYASTPAQLIAARALLGLAAAFVLPLSLAVLPVLFAEAERRRALAVVAGSAVAAYPIGPLLGGWLLSHFWWGSVFLINVPVIALALPVVALFLPESRGRAPDRPDLAGVVLSATGLATLTYGVIQAGDRGWGDRQAVAFMAIGALVLTALIGWTKRAAHRGPIRPLIDLDLFRVRGFSAGVILSTLLTFALIGLLFAVPQYFRAVLGYDAMETGLRLLPLIGGMIVGLGLGDRVSVKVGARIATAAGFSLAAVGLLAAAFTSAERGTLFVAAWLAACGVGTGVALPPTIDAALGSLDGEHNGVGSALIAAVRQVGGAFGVAVLGSVLNSAYRGCLRLDNLPPATQKAISDNVTTGIAMARRLGSHDLTAMIQHAFTYGMDVSLAWSAGIAASAAVLAAVLIPRAQTRGSLPQSRSARGPR